MAFKPTQFNNDSQLEPIAACCGGTGLTTPGTTGNVLTSNGTTWVSSAGGGGGGGTTSANGRISLFGPYRSQPTSYCWRSPGAGTAVIEIWGGGGGGAGGQCCGVGIPGNSGAYSRSTITVTASGFVCGQVGGSTYATSGCIGCRGCHSDASLAPAGSITTTMCAQGGFAGVWNCNTGTAQFCCFLANGYCGTSYSSLPPLSSPGCGFICNIGSTGLGLGVITAATAAGGDCNISGGISCVDYCTCDAAGGGLSVTRFYHSFPACDTRQPGHVLVCYCETASSYSRGEGAFELSYNRLTMGGGANPMRYFFTCMGCVVDCGCYSYGVNAPGIVGAGYGSQAAQSGGVTNAACGSSGGPGLVKITWIG